MREIKKKYQLVAQNCEEVNSLTLKLSSNNIQFFSPISVSVRFSHSELCFYTFITWLYILFFEASGRNVEFIKKKIVAYQIGVSKAVIELPKLVHAFRTVLQHNLDLTSNRDSDMKKMCNYWFYERIQKAWPENDEEWERCIYEFISEADEFIGGILSCLKEIEKREHKDLILSDWEKLITRNYSVFEFEQVLIEVLRRLGLQNIFDTNSISKKYIGEWRKDIDLLPDGFNFEFEAHRIIERFILKREIIPIDGRDIISLGVPPGPKILDLLIKAKAMFLESPCNKEKLIERVREII